MGKNLQRHSMWLRGIADVAANLFAPVHKRPAGAHPVGCQSLLLQPAHEHPAHQALVWYPAASGATERKHAYTSVYSGHVAVDAAVADGHFPLLLLSHGLQGSRFDLSWLGERLAAAGYIALAIDHIGTSASTFVAQHAPQMWRRTQQLAEATAAFVAQPHWRAHVQPGKIATIGHSAGGSAALVQLGARPDPELFLQRYPNCGPVPDDMWPMPTLCAAVLLAPGTGRLFSDAGIRAVHKPVLIVSGQADWMTPDKYNAARYAKLLPHARWHSLPNAGHFVFKPCCSNYGKLRAPALCNDCWGVDRAQVHAQTSAWILEFLREVFSAQSRAPLSPADGGTGAASAHL